MSVNINVVLNLTFAKSTVEILAESSVDICNKLR